MRYLLGYMFRFNNETIFPAVDAALLANERLVFLPTTCYELELEKPLTEEMTNKWLYDHGEWKHGSGNSGAHNRLGMAYAWWATNNIEGLNIALGDSPDFCGTTLHGMHREHDFANVAGDIGVCSFLAFNNGFMNLGFHSYWISVLNPTKQILIQFNYNPNELHRRGLFGSWQGRKENLNYSSSEDIHKIFYCRACEKWSISEESRMHLAAKWDKEAEESRSETNSP